MTPRAVFEFFAFYSNLDLTAKGIEAGITGVVVDLEKTGKIERQLLYNTQVNEHFVSDIEKVKKATSATIICRINGGEFLERGEIQSCLDAGADEILVPMITSLAEIDTVLAIIKDQARLSLMIETNEAIDLVKQINQYPVHRVFVGLNDLSIARNHRNLFLPMVDGTVDYIRENISTHFGVGGLTHPGLGSPVRCRLLTNEMKRLGCTFGFLRRSYYADLAKYSQKDIVDALNNEFASGEFDPSLSLELKDQIMDSTDLLLKTG
jgi:2-keto-3-deoxy-L-rhamnonate aldolase RhmA